MAEDRDSKSKSQSQPRPQPSPTQQLPGLPDVSRVSESVIRILSQNPGPFTLQGTNTYLISPPNASHRLLLDTGQGSQFPNWRLNLRRLLDSESERLGKEVKITQCVLSHWHQDHVGGIGELRKICDEAVNLKRDDTFNKEHPTIFKFPLFDEDSNSEKPPFETRTREREKQLLTSANDDQDVGMIHDLHDGQILVVGDDGAEDEEKLKLEVVHTPGHTADHVALVIISSPSGPQEIGSIFTADAVLGHGTAVFEDLSQYIKSLNDMKGIVEQACLDLRTKADEGKHETDSQMRTNSTTTVKAYPGHGVVVDDALARISEYIAHRAMREREILIVMSSSGLTSADLNSEVSGGQKDREQQSTAENASNEWTVEQVVRTVYKDINAALYPAAARGAQQVLFKLENEGSVERRPSAGASDEKWRVVKRSQPTQVQHDRPAKALQKAVI